MAGASVRTPEQIRDEIARERKQLATAVEELQAEARRTGRVAGLAFAAGAGALLARPLRALRRGRR